VWERGVSLTPSSSHEWPRWSPDSILIDGHACSLQQKETKRQSKPVVHHACIRRTMLRLRSSARGRTKEDTNIRLKFMGSRFSKAWKTSTCLHERPQTTQQLYLSPSTYTNTKIRRRNLRFLPQIRGPSMLLCTKHVTAYMLLGKLLRASISSLYHRSISDPQPPPFYFIIFVSYLK